MLLACGRSSHFYKNLNFHGVFTTLLGAFLLPAKDLTAFRVLLAAPGLLLSASGCSWAAPGLLLADPGLFLASSASVAVHT